METRTDEIADRIYRISTFIPEIAPPAGFSQKDSLSQPANMSRTASPEEPLSRFRPSVPFA